MQSMLNSTKSRNGARSGAGASELFLSPHWIEQVVDKVEASKHSDPYFSGLISDVNLTVVYIINGVPPHVAHWYGADEQAILTVRLRWGSVQQIEVGGKLPAKGEAHVMVTTEYETAKRLLKGELSPASTFINNGVTAKPMNGFRNWPTLATKSVVMASRVLRTARKVPTNF
jgi:hypothetical protein